MERKNITTLQDLFDSGEISIESIKKIQASPLKTLEELFIMEECWLTELKLDLADIAHLKQIRNTAEFMVQTLMEKTQLCDEILQQKSDEDKKIIEEFKKHFPEDRIGKFMISLKIAFNIVRKEFKFKKNGKALNSIGTLAVISTVHLNIFTSVIKNLDSFKKFATNLKILVPIIKSTGGNFALQSGVELWQQSSSSNWIVAGICFAVEAGYNGYLLYKGEISGKVFLKRCASSALSTAVGVVAGVYGGSLGLAIGSALLPGLGSIIGLVLGSLICGLTAQVATRTLADYILGDTENQIAISNNDISSQDFYQKMVEFLNSYHNCKITSSTSLNELKEIKKKMILKYHPDKNQGKEEEAKAIFVDCMTALECIESYKILYRK